ncbi:MAG: glycosyltransferase family 4 protein [Rubrivivax sp.]|nr:glycosyltransferase family 4 protein [Rubrivivax sp.]
MGEHVRCTHRALARAAVNANVMDIYGLSTPEPAQQREFGPLQTARFGDINIFHINGDEVRQAMAHVTYNTPLTGYNIVYPAWELAMYPAEWAEQLDRFDEIWAPSQFIADSLAAACKKPIHHMPLGTEVMLQDFLPRKRFGIPEADLVFLFFFDLKSYLERKNPRAVLQAFRNVMLKRPYARARLVIKANGFDETQTSHIAFRDDVLALGGQAQLLTETLTDEQVKNLVRCCDCFVSLHRSEGFGRGIAEAMYLGKPVVATGYSGNMDFMTPDTSYVVDHALVPVKEGQYPFASGQFWAEPDVDHAARLMGAVLDEPLAAAAMGQRARLHMIREFSYRPTGVRYRDRLDAIANGSAPRDELQGGFNSITEKNT